MTSLRSQETTVRQDTGLGVSRVEHLCSKGCGRPRAPSSHSWCRECIAAYARENRTPYHLLSYEQQGRVVARAYANVYQRRGKLIPQPCERMGPDCQGPIEKHHDDYDRPLDVRWFCRHHHKVLR